MRAEDEMFKPDPEKYKYTIELVVYENCCLTQFRGPDGEILKKINFHNAIGVLETQKQHLMWGQREQNLAKKMNPKKHIKNGK